jgi:hypothetical protein
MALRLPANTMEAGGGWFIQHYSTVLIDAVMHLK